MSIPIFADLYKPIKDVLTKGYQGDSHKLEITTKDQVKFNPCFTRDASGNISGSLSVEGDYIPCPYAKTKLKYAINEKGILNTKVTIDNLQKMKGLKLEGVADLAVGVDISKDKYEGKLEYKHEKATLSGSLKQDFNGEASAVSAIQDLQFGALATCNVCKRELKGTQVGAAYKVSKATTIAAILENFQSLKAGFATSSNGWTWAGEYTCKISDATNGIVTVGAETTLKDGQTVKGRLNTKGVIGASIAHKISSEMKLTSSIEVETAKGFTSKIGSQLTWESA